MAGKTQDQADAVLNTARGSAMASWTPWAVLLSVAPSDDSAEGTELSGSNYSRVAVTFSAPVDATAGKLARRCYPTGHIEFPTASADWSAAVAWGLRDASSGGALRYWGLLPASRTVTSGNLLRLVSTEVYIEEG